MSDAIVAGHYLIEEAIGRGGMGTVARATDLRTGGPVAIKFLHATLAGDPRVVERLRREARLAALIDSPHVVRVLDLVEHQGTPAIVMEYVPGPTLADVVAARGRLPAAEALAITRAVALALEAAHRHGIVHRDLKLDNIKAMAGAIKVLDYGLARVEGDTSISPASLFLGTPEYTAPERMDGLGDIRGDIYATGVILFRLLEGRLPFTGRTPMMVMNGHLNMPIPPLSPDVLPAVAALTRRCLAKRPEDRYQHPVELVAALDRLLALPATLTMATPAALTPLPEASAAEQDAMASVFPPPSQPDGPARPALPARNRRLFWIFNGIVAAVIVLAAVVVLIALR